MTFLLEIQPLKYYRSEKNFHIKHYGVPGDEAGSSAVDSMVSQRSAIAIASHQAPLVIHCAAADHRSGLDMACAARLTNNR